MEVNGAKGKDRLILYEGEVESNIKDKRKLQAYIERLLGFGPEVFISAIMFPQKGKRFIEEPGPKKKEILEMAFNLTWISEVAEVLKAHRKSLGTDQGILTSIIAAD